jgi:hypothetical protein
MCIWPPDLVRVGNHKADQREAEARKQRGGDPSRSLGGSRCTIRPGNIPRREGAPIVGASRWSSHQLNPCPSQHGEVVLASMQDRNNRSRWEASDLQQADSLAILGP